MWEELTGILEGRGYAIQDKEPDSNRKGRSLGLSFRNAFPAQCGPRAKREAISIRDEVTAVLEGRACTPRQRKRVPHKKKAEGFVFAMNPFSSMWS